MQISRTRRGRTLRLSEREAAELQQTLALTIAAYGLLHTFMTPGQKAFTEPSVYFAAQLGHRLGTSGDGAR